MSLPESTTEVLSSANATLASHSALLARIRTSQKQHRRQLRALPAPPYDILRLPLLPSPPRSPSPSPPPSPGPAPSHIQVVTYQNQQRAERGDRPSSSKPELPLAKRARAARYKNYIPEEETIRNDYSQRYVDGGEWPQNWVTGADPSRRFEE
jgi:mRNA m6A methyltransferase non-catalytic subunit